MGSNKYNAEGYYDPTAYEALTNIETEAKKTSFKPLVYICSPFAGDIEHNTIRARGYSRFAVSKNAIPLAPHLLFPQFMDDSDKQEREKALFMGIVLLAKCQEIWCFGSRISKGMAIELDKAKQRNMVIRYFNDKCQEGINNV
jgi:hypothetical protein